MLSNTPVSEIKNSVSDLEGCQKENAMIKLLYELNTGICSTKEEDWISEEDFRSHFKNRRNDK